MAKDMANAPAQPAAQVQPLADLPVQSTTNVLQPLAELSAQAAKQVLELPAQAAKKCHAGGRQLPHGLGAGGKTSRDASHDA